MGGNTLFLFTRDLRLTDNAALTHAVRLGGKLYGAFVFIPAQFKGNYFSPRALHFLIQAVRQLRKLAPILVIEDSPSYERLREFCNEREIDKCVISRDYTPYHARRVQVLSTFVEVTEIDNHVAVCGELREYHVYTPFLRYYLPLLKKVVAFPGHRAPFTAVLRVAPEYPEKYQKKQDLVASRAAGFARIPGSGADTRIGAYLKFGVIGPREYYEKVRGVEHLVAELVWRDFFYLQQRLMPRHVGLNGEGEAYRNRAVARGMSSVKYGRWCAGRTGCPIVDAGMRQLNEVGWIPNRMRLIVASYLCYDLGLWWRLGESYFAQQLIDYDPAINSWNWAWVAGTGNATRSARMSMVRQQMKVDSMAKYVLRWCEEYKDRNEVMAAYDK